MTHCASINLVCSSAFSNIAKVVLGLRSCLVTRMATRPPTPPLPPSVKVNFPQRTADLELHQLLERDVGFIDHGIDRDLRLRDFGREMPFPDRVAAEFLAHEHLQQTVADSVPG